METGETQDRSTSTRTPEDPGPGQPPSLDPPSPPEPQAAEQSEEEVSLEERRRKLGLPADAPEALVDAAELEQLAEPGDRDGDQGEVEVLNFLLGPTEPLHFEVDAFIDTPGGMGKLTFHCVQLADDEIEALEDEWAEGEGPFRQINRVMLNAAKVAKSCLYLEDRNGRVEVDSPEFRGPIPSPVDAMRGRFKFIPGVLAQVAAEIDGKAGMRQDGRVGMARPASSDPAPSGEQTITSAVGKS